MNNDDTSESRAPSTTSAGKPAPAAEEIIFPVEPPAAPPMREKTVFTRTRLLGWALFMSVAYAASQLAAPDSVRMLRQRWLDVWTLAQEKALTLAAKRPASDMGPQAAPPAAGVKTEAGKPPPERKIKYWWDPMMPAYKSDKPGKSPMGMDMTPVYEDEAAADGGVKLAPGVAQQIGVKTVTAGMRALAHEIRTTGRITYDERKVMRIHTKFEGWIEKLYVDFTGQVVNEGDPLVDIYSPVLLSTQEELLSALEYRDSLRDSHFPEIQRGAESLIQSTVRRLELFDVPPHQIEALLRDRQVSKTLHLHSIAKGFVIEKNALHGMHILPGMSLYSIADISNIWVMADIYEYELPWVKMGQAAEMTLSYFPGKKFLGRVAYIDPYMDPKTRTVKVRVEVDNAGWHLKPDMYANVLIKIPLAKKTVAVPEEAVIHAGRKNLIVVSGDDGAFDSREVTLGSRADGYIQVLAGVKAGEKVVTSANFLIDSESKLKEAVGKMSGDGADAPAAAGENQVPVDNPAP